MITGVQMDEVLLSVLSVNSGCDVDTQIHLVRVNQSSEFWKSLQGYNCILECKKHQSFNTIFISH